MKGQWVTPVQVKGTEVKGVKCRGVDGGSGLTGRLVGERGEKI